MIIKVPLKSCKYLTAEQVTKVKTLMSQHLYIKHQGTRIDARIEQAQYLAEAFAMLRNPINAMIADARNNFIDAVKAEELVKKYVGKRFLEHHLELFAQEEQTIWGLFNALTWRASHEDLSDSKREKLLERASNLLEQELTIEA